MLISHGLDLVASQHHVAYVHVEAGVLHVIRKAVEAILAVVFILGLLIGFVAGKAYGRRQR